MRKTLPRGCGWRRKRMRPSQPRLIGSGMPQTGTRRWRGGGANRDAARKRARANRAVHRPRSGTQRCEMPRTGKRPHPNAILRLRSGAGAMRNGAFRARVPLGRWTAHADRHCTHSPTTQTRHHTRKDARLRQPVRNSLTHYRRLALHQVRHARPRVRIKRPWRADITRRKSSGNVPHGSGAQSPMWKAPSGRLTSL